MIYTYQFQKFNKPTLIVDHNFCVVIKKGMAYMSNNIVFVKVSVEWTL